jgi:23S rRNA (uracil1939-C5)-methyltransferase
MAYSAQLAAKRTVVVDQLKRIGNLEDVDVRATLAAPLSWNYRDDVELSPVPDGGLGFWSPSARRIIPIQECHVIHPLLLDLWHDFDLASPDLRKLTLRKGDDDALMAALEVENVQPPELLVDFPISVAIVLPDKTAASLVGDSFLIQSVKGRDFRVSPGCHFRSNPAATDLLVTQVLSYAALTGKESVLEGYSGVGMMTSFLSEVAGQIVAVEQNRDAVADAAANLHQCDNVTIYHSRIEEVIRLLKPDVDVVIVEPPASGLSKIALKALLSTRPQRLVYVSSDIATLSRDGQKLKQAGYRLAQVQPIDSRPQTFHIDTVSLFLRS